MEKTFSGAHPGTSKTNSVFSAERTNSARKIGRTHSPGSVSVGSPAGGTGNRGRVAGNSVSLQQAHRGHLEGVLCKYTNLLQGWQNRYFVLDPELGQLQYFVNEHVKNQKPRGSLPLIGAVVAQSDEAPHMFTVHSTNGELYKLRASDAKEQQFWMNQLQTCARRHSDSSAKLRKLKGSDEHLYVEKTGNGQEGLIMTQVEGQQKNLVHSIESLPTRGPLSCLDQDLLLLKATSAATLSCLGSA